MCCVRVNGVCVGGDKNQQKNRSDLFIFLIWENQNQVILKTKLEKNLDDPNAFGF